MTKLKDLKRDLQKIYRLLKVMSYTVVAVPAMVVKTFWPEITGLFEAVVKGTKAVSDKLLSRSEIKILLKQYSFIFTQIISFFK